MLAEERVWQVHHHIKRAIITAENIENAGKNVIGSGRKDIIGKLSYVPLASFCGWSHFVEIVVTIELFICFRDKHNLSSDSKRERTDYAVEERGRDSGRPAHREDGMYRSSREVGLLCMSLMPMFNVDLWSTKNINKRYQLYEAVLIDFAKANFECKQARHF